ncbi:MAG TPA: ATP phosphoribosyltransferase regulatory subunit, partial [Candidatus Krumholzibacteria bacterium]|nr:ATP phosphoribosyltransferase regulatory subunit [Candidatus Krumholzibacteria bacterium]
AEAIGSDSPALDAEIIQLVVEVLRELGFVKVDVRLNSVGTEKSRAPYRVVLRDAIHALSGEIDPESLERYTANPLRIFDSKEYGEKLKRRLPAISDHLVAEDAAHFARVKDALGAVAVPFQEDTFLVRGLDYYTRTVFEIYHGEHGAQSALCGGGRYDNLIGECGGPDTPAIGFSAGLERIVGALPDGAAAGADAGPRVRFYVACLGPGAEARGLAVARVLRPLGGAQVDLSGRSRRTQIESALKSGARVAVVVDAGRADAAEWHDLRRKTEYSVAESDLEAFARRAASDEGEQG